MKHAARISLLSILLITLSASLWAQNNPAPLVDQSLVPASAAPGASGFTLAVSGAGFVSGAVVNWNGSARTTTFVSSSNLQASINTSDLAKASTASITVVNPAPGGGTSNVVYFPIRASATAVAFAPEPSVSLLAGPVAVADFNGDGKLDVAVGRTSSDGNTGSILMYRGNGHGGFSTPSTSNSTLPVLSLLVGDFNGDGKPDLVIGTKNGGLGPAEAIVFLNNGSGKFTEQTPFGTGEFGGPIGVGDFNGDGILDIAFESEIQGSGTVYIYLGNGDGTYSLSQRQDMIASGERAAVGDFNGDGKLDLAVSDYRAVDVFIGNGDGTFQPYVSYPLTSACGIVAAAADLNADGKLDLVLSGACSMLGNGDGTFAAAVPSAGGPVAAVADLNGDGKLDTIGATTTSVVISLGNGDGTFQAPLTSGGFALDGSETLAIGDFNRDGQIDVALAGSAADQVGLQTALSLSINALSYGTHKIGTNSKPQDVTLTNIGSQFLHISSITLAGADPGDFVEHNGCGGGIAAGKSCAAKIIFQPTAKGARTATLNITYVGTDSPQTVTLTGTGY